MNSPDNVPIAVALDVTTLDEAERLAASLASTVGWFKIGLELFAAEGPRAVQVLGAYGRIFLDLKLHDIPTTVLRTARRLAALDVELVTVHALGGPAMIAAAAEGLGSGDRVLAVTILTSMSSDDLAAIGFPTQSDRVASLAAMATSAGAGGIVCAAAQAAQVRATVGPERNVVTPGIRPQGSGDDDHDQAWTPQAAVAAGANLLVIGRPITGADDPVQAAGQIAASVATDNG